MKLRNVMYGMIWYNVYKESWRMWINLRAVLFFSWWVWGACSLFRSYLGNMCIVLCRQCSGFCPSTKTKVKVLWYVYVVVWFWSDHHGIFLNRQTLFWKEKLDTENKLILNFFFRFFLSLHPSFYHDTPM